MALYAPMPMIAYKAGNEEVGRECKQAPRIQRAAQVYERDDEEDAESQ
jgi:hypothetical protein